VEYLALGERIRQLRVERALSLKELSLKAGISEDLLKKIEADQDQPLIGQLISLSKALDVNVADVFRDRPRSQKFEIIRKGERERVKPLLQSAKTKVFDYQYELLTRPADDKHLDAYLIELAPHQSKPPRQDMTHPGEEFIYLLEGKLEGEIAGESFKMEAGDSLFLRSTQPHVFFNPGDKPARALTVIYPF